MDYLILVILIIIGYILISILLIRLLTFFRKNQTQITRLLFISFGCFGITYLIQSSRIIIALLFGQYYELWDQVLFILCYVFIFIGVMSGIRRLWIMNFQLGREIKHTNMKTYIFIGTVVTFGIINSITFYNTPVDQFGFFLYQINPYLAFIILLTFFPMLFMITFSASKIYKEFKDRQMARNYQFLGYFSASYTITHYFYLVFYPIFPNVNLISIIYLIINIIIISSTLTLYFKNPDLFEILSTYFCVKTLHIVKLSGQALIGYDFKKEEKPDYFSSRKILLGGFLLAISSGIGLAADLEGAVETIKIGNTSLIVRHGKYSFGVLYTTEDTKTLHDKLDKFMAKFERIHEDYFLNWTGEISKFKSKGFDDMIYEFFRY